MSIIAGPSIIFPERILEDDGEEEEDLPNKYTFIVHLGDISGLKPVYSISKLSLKVEFGNQLIYQADDLLMSEVVSINGNIFLTLDLTDLYMLNQFITCPLVFSLMEYETNTETQSLVEFGKNQILWHNEESVMEFSEALWGKKVSNEEKTQSRRTSKKTNTATKTSLSSIVSKKGKGKNKSTVTTLDSSAARPSGPQVAGSTSIDLLPFFKQETEISQKLILRAPAGQPLDDRMKAAANLPFLEVQITLDKPIPCGEIIYYSLESIYNLPKVMSSNLNYQIAVTLPLNLTHRTVTFSTYTYENTKKKEFTFKKYYETNVDSKFVLRDDFDNVKFIPPLKKTVAISDTARLDFNVVKPEFVSASDLDSFKIKLMKYRCIGIEVYVQGGPIKRTATDQSVKLPRASKKDDKKSKKDSKTSTKKMKDHVSEKSDEDHLHLMGFVDLCRLLCPGELKTRVAVQLRTFNMQEYEEGCGLNDSYFRPKPVIVPINDAKSEKPGKKDKPPDKDSKSTKSSKSAVKNGKGQGDLRNKLPPPPEKLPPSVEIYNEDGQPTFIIIEFEFREPLVPARDVEDLHEQLFRIFERLPQGAKEPHVFNSKYIARDMFQDSIREIAKSLRGVYKEYLESGGIKDCVHTFLHYISTNRRYEEYIMTLTKTAAAFCNVGASYELNFNKEEYETFIGNAYVELVALINTTLTQISLVGDTTPKIYESGEKDLLFFAKEAVEIGALGLATRYYLQRICNEDNSSDYWLDYGVFKLQIGEDDTAEQCALEALRHCPTHRNSLLLYACLISRRGLLGEAETCLLNVTLNNPKWTEGWIALYCVYHRSKNIEGMELCLEMAERYEGDHEWNKSADLLWNAADLPQKFTYSAIVFFINMRLFDEAELLIADELILRQTDTIEYLLGVINIYKGHFEHAMDHIEISIKIGKCSYKKDILKGHLFATLNDPQNALQEYNKVLKADVDFDSSIYLVYIRAGLCYSALGKNAEARKVMLYASEKCGTPYSWLSVGVLYYSVKDYNSAEECFTISNALDNIMPETWAYLTLVNMRLNRPNEASNCYQLARDNRLQNQELLKLIEAEVKTFENKNPENE